MKIADTTPTGHVGSRLVRLLVQAGTRPTLPLRDPAKLESRPTPVDHGQVRPVLSNYRTH